MDIEELKGLATMIAEVQEETEKLEDKMKQQSSELDFFNDTATTEIYTLSYTLSLHDALP
eukprot:COSAG06_NODE_62103_length_266_cov_0.562874_1_plen_59_part_01